MQVQHRWYHASDQQPWGQGPSGRVWHRPPLQAQGPARYQQKQPAGCPHTTGALEMCLEAMHAAHMRVSIDSLCCSARGLLAFMLCTPTIRVVIPTRRSVAPPDPQVPREAVSRVVRAGRSYDVVCGAIWPGHAASMGVQVGHHAAVVESFTLVTACRC